MAETASTEFLALQKAIAGRYSLERELGRGGMGIVYLARDVALDRPVAIKLLPPALATQSELRERFLREARTAAGLSHPNIVPIHGVEEHGDLVFFVMGFVDGESVRDRVVRAGPLAPTAAMKMLQEVAWALAHAHAKGIVHRDVKPDNILIERASGRALVTDFGIARVMDEQRMTATGEIVGTAAYVSPEQASGEPIDARSDLYSLGVTAFFALTGRPPFEAPTPLALLVKHLNEPAPPVATLRPELPAKLAEAVDRCLAKDPAARLATGEDLAEAVGAALGTVVQLPLEVRAFMREAQRWGSQLGTYVVALPFILWLAGRDVAAPAGVVLLIVWLFGSGRVAAAVRRLLSEGMTFDQVRAALLADARAQEEEAKALGRVKKFLGNRRLAVVTGGFFSVLGGFFLYAASFSVSSRTPGMAISLAFFGVLVGIPGLVVFGWGLGLKWARRVVSKLEQQSIGILVNRVWAGWLGKLLFRWFGRGEVQRRLGKSLFGWLRRGKVERPGLPSVEPTEVLLGEAANEIYRGLSKEQRNQLGAVPDAIRRLEADAKALRNRETDLARALAEMGGEDVERHKTRIAAVRSDPDAGEEAALLERRMSMIADLEVQRQLVGSRLATAVAALENLRLGLLRLRAGAGSLDDLTADLEAAEEIDRRIDAELEVAGVLESN
jgi:serine/threonine-protein kinase